jgi:hypothetical protein
MIDHELVKKYFVGRDGFVWWIGQVTSEEKWAPNIPGRRVETTNQIDGYGDRYKVRIFGYHDLQYEDNALSDDDLPWAQIMLPVTAGGGGGASFQSPNIRQGTFVFGFFLDGDDAQQPMIMGILGYNNYTLVDRNIPRVKFVPFDGYSKKDKVPESHIRTTPEVSSTVTGENAIPDKDATAPKPSSSGIIINGAQDQFKEYASKNQEEDGRKASPLKKPVRCEDTQGLSGISLTIKNLLVKIQELQNKLNSWESAINGKIDNIQQEIDKLIELASKKAAEFLKIIVDNIRKYTVELVEDKAKDFYYLLFPNERDKLKETQLKVIDGLSCLFSKIIGGLRKLVTNMLKDLVGKMLNAPACAIENIVGTLLGNILGSITSAIDSIISPISDLIGQVFSLTDDILSFIKNLLGFFTCEEELSCPETEEWSIWKGEANKGPAPSLKNVINKAKNIAPSAKNSFNNAASGVSGAISNVSNSFSGAFQNALNSCDVGPLLCGPPQVVFGGGGGFGASANAIISSTGELMGIDILSGGSGYTSPPSVSIQDACGKGKGAKVKVNLKPTNPKQTGPSSSTAGDESANEPVVTLSVTPSGNIEPGESVTICWDVKNATNILNSNFGASGMKGCAEIKNVYQGQTLILTSSNTNKQTTATIKVNVGSADPNTQYEVESAVVLDPGTGYLRTPDGSFGSFGNLWATKDKTIVRNPDYSWRFPISPGESVQVDPGSLIITPKTIVGFGTDNEQNDIIPAGIRYIVNDTTRFTAPFIETEEEIIVQQNFKREVFQPSNSRGDYPVVLYICGVEIVSGGLNYDSRYDTVEITPNFGAKLSIKTGPFGIIEKVDIIDGGIGFSEYPEITINTSTGFNAELVPIFCVKRIGNEDPEKLSELLPNNSIITVVDCVGRG